MDFSKVKLVVSDMDGTLLNNKGEVSSLFFELVDDLKKKGVVFCAASGRQYNSILQKLATLKEDIYIIAENGAIAKKSDQILSIQPLSKSKTKKIIPILRTIKGAEVVLCSKNSAFIETKNKGFTTLFQEYYHTYSQVDDLLKILETTEILKVAIYHHESSEKYIYPKLKEFKDEIFIKISGKNWLDISDEKANKGNAVRELQQSLSISKQETMVFGDYHNDIEMLQEASFSYAMKNAHKDILKIANYSTDDNNNYGVEKILKQVLASK